MVKQTISSLSSLMPVCPPYHVAMLPNDSQRDRSQCSAMEEVEDLLCDSNCSCSSGKPGENPEIQAIVAPQALRLTLFVAQHQVVSCCRQQVENRHLAGRNRQRLVQKCCQRLCKTVYSPKSPLLAALVSSVCRNRTCREMSLDLRLSKLRD